MKRKFLKRVGPCILTTLFLLAPIFVFAENPPCECGCGSECCCCSNTQFIPFSIETGGTGATNAADAKENLGIGNTTPIVTTAGTSSDLTATVENWTVADGKMLVIIPHTTGSTSAAITLNVNGDGAKTLTCVDSFGADGSFSNAAPVVTSGVPLLVVRGNSQWYVVNISKPNVGSVNGTLPIANGGTGASSASSAVSNLGISFTSGTWTPSMSNAGTPSYSYRSGLWRCIEFGSFRMMFISFYIIANISSVSGYANITGLPRQNPGDSVPLAVCDCSNMALSAPNTMFVAAGSTHISIRGADGVVASQWKTGTTYIRGAGWYICST